MRYCLLNNNAINLKDFYDGLEVIMIEIDCNGKVIKEIGLNINKQIVHAFPSKRFKHGRYGLFDLSVFELLDKRDDITVEEFYSFWSKLSSATS